MKSAYLSLIALTLAACSTNAPVLQQSASYDANSQARIRLYGQNQVPSSAFIDIDCSSNPKGTELSTGASLGEAFSSLIGTSKSKSIGIAATETSKNIGKLNGIASRAFFKEFVIPAGKPINVQTYFVGLTNVSRSPTVTIIQTQNSCSSNKGSFVPQAGHDYEVVDASGGNCSVSVFEVSTTGTQTPIALQKAISCQKH